MQQAHTFVGSNVSFWHNPAAAAMVGSFAAFSPSISRRLSTGAYSRKYDVAPVKELPSPRRTLALDDLLCVLAATVVIQGPAQLQLL
jgi:hypothetical protein